MEVDLGDTMHVFSDSAIITFGHFLEIAKENPSVVRSFEAVALKIEKYMVKASGGGVVNMFFVWTFLILVNSSTTVLHFFKCHSFNVPEADGGGTESFLFKDYSVRRND